MLDFLSITHPSITQVLCLLAATSMVENIAGWGSSFWSIFQVAIGLGFVIFVHELGHFLAAKFFGVKCEKFYVGFDVPIRLGPIRLPAKLLHFQWGETEYGIGSIPLGGYVKMLGQDDDPRNAEKENERIRVAGPDQTEAIGRPQYDPRSFPAKSVFARMVIISAGVVMNIIFGIIFAAVAFNIGVPYEPTIVGDVLPGDPAWQAGLQSGDRILQVAEMKKPNPNLTFRDMQESVILAGLDHPEKPILVLADREGEAVRLEIVGTKRHDPKSQMMSMGITSPLVTRVSPNFPFPALLSANWPEAKDVLPNLEPGDTIIGVNGVKLEKKYGMDAPLERDLNLQLHPLFDQTVTLQVERPTSKDSNSSTETIDVDWKPFPMRTLGIGFQVGPVVSIQVGSAAEKAGVSAGDILVSLNGNPIENAFTLPLMVAKQKGKSVTLTLRRALEPSQDKPASDASKKKENKLNSATDSEIVKSTAAGEEYSFEWKVPTNFQLRDNGMQYNPVGLELPGSGIVVSPLTTVASFKKQAGNHSSPGLIAGDQIQQIRFDLDTDESMQAKLKLAFGKEIWNELVQGKKLEGGYSSQFFNSLVQHLPIGTKLRVYFFRDNKVENIGVEVANDPDWAWFNRGLVTQPAKLTHQASSISEAVSLGVTEIGNKASGVLRFVRMAFAGKIPSNAAAGPAMIFYVATSAASESTTKLLMFLTMLSANLAVLNFLPIPALDGGHMIFLIFEAIRGKPVDEALQMRLTVAGVVALLSLMAFVIINDVMNFTRIFS